MKQRVALVVVAVVAAGLGYQVARIRGDSSETLRLAQSQANADTKQLALNTSPEDYEKLVELGYDVFDVGPSTDEIEELPEGGMAMLWVGEFSCDDGFGISDEEFESLVDELGDNERVYGWYLVDEPDPGSCPEVVDGIRRRADYIHEHAEGQKAFVSATDYEYAPLRPENSHLDLIGLDPYPCRDDEGERGCDLAVMDRFVGDATEAGIPRDVIVPVIQTFGQACAENKGWVLPNEEELRQILAKWDELVPSSPLEISYSWGHQEEWACPTLVDADGTDDQPDLQSIMRERNVRTAPEGGPDTTECTTPTSTSSTTAATTAPPADPDAGGGDGATAAAALGYDQPAFSDDFDTFDEGKWMVYSGPSEHIPGEFDAQGGGRRTREQISVADGVMTITGLPNGDTAGMSTEESHSQQHGLWEARVKLPANAVDYHSVLILMAGDTELDFMEDMDPAGRTVNGFMHLPSGDDNGEVTLSDNQWHNWAVEWTPERLRLYLDGELWHETSDGAQIPTDEGIMTIQLDWFPRDEGETTQAELQVDWVRIYAARA